MTKQHIEVGAGVANRKQNEGGGDSDYRKGERGKEWSTNTQNRLRDDLAADIEKDIQKQTLDLKKQIPYREVQRGDTLLAIVAAMKKAGALAKGIGSINNLKVEFQKEGKKFKNMFAKDLLDIHSDQKVWVRESDKTVVVGDSLGSAQDRQEVGDEEQSVEVEGSVVEEADQETQEAQEDQEQVVEKDPNTAYQKALAALVAEAKKRNPDLQKLMQLKSEVEQLEDVVDRHTEIEENPLQAVKDLILQLQTAERGEKVETAQAAVRELERLLGETGVSAREIQDLINGLEIQSRLAAEKVKVLDNTTGDSLRNKLTGLQAKVQPKLGELEILLAAAKLKEKLAENEKRQKEEQIRAQKERAEKLEQSVAVNQEKLKSLGKIKEGNSDLGSILSKAIQAIGAALGLVKEEILRGNFSRVDKKEKAFTVKPGQVKTGKGTSRLPSYGAIHTERPTGDKKNLLVRFQAAENINAFASKQGIKFRSLDDLFMKSDLRKRASKESVVRYYNGEEEGRFWKFEPHNNNRRTNLVADVKINNKRGWIRVDAGGAITDRAGKRLQRAELHKNDLKVIERILGINLTEEE